MRACGRARMSSVYYFCPYAVRRCFFSRFSLGSIGNGPLLCPQEPKELRMVEVPLICALFPLLQARAKADQLRSEGKPDGSRVLTDVCAHPLDPALLAFLCGVGDSPVVTKCSANQQGLLRCDRACWSCLFCLALLPLTGYPPTLAVWLGTCTPGSVRIFKNCKVAAMGKASARQRWESRCPSPK